MMSVELEKKSTNTPSVTINEIKFNDGTKVSLRPDDIIVFVGANNVGKSRALKDISNDLIDNSRSNIIINKIKYATTNFDEKSVRQYFARNFSKNSQESYEVYVTDNVSHFYTYMDFENISYQERKFYKVFFNFLSTSNRLNMTLPISYSNIQDICSLNIMKKLETDSKSIFKLNEILLSCFNRAIDVSEEKWLNSVSKLYKFGTKDEIDETINSDTRSARKRLEYLENLNEQGDGIRSAVAILASLIANESSLYLIDEPETFLHPPQAKILGNNIVELSENKQCFISTHNIDLIRGILEKKSSRVKIIKIDRTNDTNKFYVLDNESIMRIANDKNLKYSNILNGLFYHNVVLCENESDCKFYSAVLDFLNNNVYQNTLFCAVGGKDQFKVIIPLLQKLKINYLIIADLDLIDNKEKLKALLNSIYDGAYNSIKNAHDMFLKLFEEESYSLIKKQKAIKQEIFELFNDDEYMSPETAKKIKNILKNVSSLKLLKSNGKASIPAGVCTEKFDEIINLLNDNNIYVVECGEIENFIPQIALHSDAWVEEVFRRYPTMEESVYDDVKFFLKRIFKMQ